MTITPDPDANVPNAGTGNLQQLEHVGETVTQSSKGTMNAT